MKQRIIFVFAFLFLFLPVISFAQQYPTKPITLTVTFAPGGTLDTSTRILASKAEKILGQSIVVSNVEEERDRLPWVRLPRRGQMGMTSRVAQARVDPDSQLRAVPYSHEDFVPIMHFTAVQSGVVVRSDSAFKTFKDLIEYARKNPGKVNYATSGAGSPCIWHGICGRQGKDSVDPCSYAGGAPGLTAILGGHVTAMSDSTEWLPM
jgi:tripartite-type tricarboxylate transporter receptor subunit TctC